jgi:hypothetical protein
MATTQATSTTTWMEQLGEDEVAVEGLVRVAGYLPDGRPPEGNDHGEGGCVRRLRGLL